MIVAEVRAMAAAAKAKAAAETAEAGAKKARESVFIADIVADLQAANAACTEA